MNFEWARIFEAEKLSCQNQCTHQFEFCKIPKSLGGNV